mmetsp:Transcript_29503/g.90279  ORF Transcript_29503/g.90279 Transcript_29503/m.90279 type:complete len:314 (-) Transcript_29503:31-972(-)
MFVSLMKIALLLPCLPGLSLSHLQDLAPHRHTNTLVSFLPVSAVSSTVIESNGTYGLVVNEEFTSSTWDFVAGDTSTFGEVLPGDASGEYGPVCAAIPNFCALYYALLDVLDVHVVRLASSWPSSLKGSTYLDQFFGADHLVELSGSVGELPQVASGIFVALSSNANTTFSRGNPFSITSTNMNHNNSTPLKFLTGLSVASADSELSTEWFNFTMYSEPSASTWFDYFASFNFYGDPLDYGTQFHPSFTTGLNLPALEENLGPVAHRLMYWRHHLGMKTYTKYMRRAAGAPWYHRKEEKEEEEESHRRRRILL